MKATLLIVIFISGAISVSAKQDPGPVFPGALEDPTFVYHPASNSMLLLGGTPVIQDSVESDVWKWNNQWWSKVDATGPGARVFFKGDLNSKTGDVELFAGAGLARNNSLRRDMWSFDGKKWSTVSTNDIGSRDHHKMVYADHLDGFVLYGGSVDHHFDTSTWLLKQGHFSRLDIPGPGARYQSAMVYDKHRKKIVLYGGGDKPDEHWEFDGTRWEQIVTDINPGVKLYHHMAYDENLKAVILHGGQVNHRPLDPKNLETPLTWMWNGRDWKKIATENIFAIAIGYHPARKSVLAYGYDNGDINGSRNLQLWELKHQQWAKLADYGKWNTMDYLEKYLNQKPGDPMALYVYAYRLKSANRFAEAEAAFKKIASYRSPQQASILRGLIEVLRLQGKLAETEEYILKYSGEERVISIMYYNLACAYALADNADKAFAMLDHAIKLGFNGRKDYEEDADLESLRSDARWPALSKRLSD
jgi:hypothetical protein